MTEATIEKVQASYDLILELLGQDSFVNWDLFTKSSTGLNKEIQELSKKLAVYRDIQHKRFISTMKTLKAYDIPDLIKTVKAKKLPKEALKTILGKFTVKEEKLELIDSKQKLREQSSKVFQQYYNNNLALTNKIKETAALIQQRIQTSGLYNVQPAYNVQPLVSTFKHTFDEAKLQAVSGTIQLQYLPGTVDTIHIKTYAKIVQSSLQVIKSQFKRLTQDARVKQRNLIKEPAQYIPSLIEYLSNTEVLIIDGQKAIYNKLGVSTQKMQESENSLMEKGLAQNLLLIQSALRTKVKESMLPQNQVSLEQAKQILRFQVNQLKTRTVYFKQLFAHLQKTPENYQLIPMLLALTLNDIVFQKYAFQQQDFMKNVNDNVIMTNPEVTNIFRDMELAIIKLMEELQIISPEASSMMLNQSQMPQPQTGLPPGSNPMDLLQMQQMQQMQQMAQFQQLQRLYMQQQQQGGK